MAKTQAEERGVLSTTFRRENTPKSHDFGVFLELVG